GNGDVQQEGGPGIGVVAGVNVPLDSIMRSRCSSVDIERYGIQREKGISPGVIIEAGQLAEGEPDDTRVADIHFGALDGEWHAGSEHHEIVAETEIGAAEVGVGAREGVFTRRPAFYLEVVETEIIRFIGGDIGGRGIIPGCDGYGGCLAVIP